MKALLALLREILDALRHIAVTQRAPFRAHGTGHDGQGTPRFLALTLEVRLVDMRGAAFVAGYRSPDMVLRLIERGRFPLPVLGGCGADYRWRVADIDAWASGLPHVALRGQVARGVGQVEMTQ